MQGSTTQAETKTASWSRYTEQVSRLHGANIPVVQYSTIITAGPVPAIDDLQYSLGRQISAGHCSTFIHCFLNISLIFLG